jgi:hypothetical protein
MNPRPTKERRQPRRARMTLCARGVAVALSIAVGAGLGCIDSRAIHAGRNADGGDGPGAGGGAGSDVDGAAERSTDGGDSLHVFVAPIYIGAGVNPLSVALGDFNDDLRIDVAVANHGSGQPGATGSVSVLLNRGSGVFEPAVDYPAGVSPRFLAIGDVNADGSPDLVVANEGAVTLGQSGGVSVLVNQGGRGPAGGVFAGAVTHPTGGSPRSVAIEDLEEDGGKEIVVANDDGSGAGVDVLKNAGGGRFSPPMRFATSPNAFSVAVGYLNPLQRPLPDIVAATGEGVSVFLNNGRESFMFAEAATYKPSAPAYAVVLSDFNGDGSLDIAVASNSSGRAAASAASAPSAPDVSVLMNNGNGTFAEPLGYGSRGQANAIALGDFNGDQKVDLILAHHGDEIAGTAGGVSVLLNKGGGTFASPVFRTIAGRPSSLAVGDLDADGWPDVVLANGEGVVLLLTRGRSAP